MMIIISVELHHKDSPQQYNYCLHVGVCALWWLDSVVVVVVVTDWETCQCQELHSLSDLLPRFLGNCSTDACRSSSSFLHIHIRA